MAGVNPTVNHSLTAQYYNENRFILELGNDGDLSGYYAGTITVEKNGYTVDTITITNSVMDDFSDYIYTGSVNAGDVFTFTFTGTFADESVTVSDSVTITGVLNDGFDAYIYYQDDFIRVGGSSTSNNGNVVVDSALSSTSENPVQNKAIKSVLDTKVDKVAGKGLSSEDYTSVEKTKLASIDMSSKEDVSNKVTSILASSTNSQYPSARAVYQAMSNFASNGTLTTFTSMLNELINEYGISNKELDEYSTDDWQDVFNGLSMDDYPIVLSPALVIILMITTSEMVDNRVGTLDNWLTR